MRARSRRLVWAVAVIAAACLSSVAGAAGRAAAVVPRGSGPAAAGTISTVFGFGGDGGPATSAELWVPAAVTTGPGGSLVISDTGNQRVRQVAG